MNPSNEQRSKQKRNTILISCAVLLVLACCFTCCLTAGFGGWYLFESNGPAATASDNPVSRQNPSPSPSPSPTQDINALTGEYLLECEAIFEDLGQHFLALGDLGPEYSADPNVLDDPDFQQRALAILDQIENDANNLKKLTPPPGYESFDQNLEELSEETIRMTEHTRQWIKTGDPDAEDRSVESANKILEMMDDLEQELKLLLEQRAN